jgi:hypothetical protein
MPPNWNGLFSSVASIGTSRGEHTTFYMSYQQIETMLSLTTRPFLQWSLFVSIYSGNQAKSQEKVWANWNWLSLFTSHVVSTSWAEHTTSYRGRATTSFISHHQLKTWSLLSKDNQSKSWEKVWANWNCLSLVTSHVVGTSRAEHTTSYMSYKQRKTLSSFTTRQPIQVLKKSVTSVFFVIDHFSCH